MNQNDNAIEDALTGYLAEDPRVDVSVSVDTELIASGLIDSLAILDLVVFVESEFDVRLKAEEITPANFFSVTTLAELIERRRG